MPFIILLKIYPNAVYTALLKKLAKNTSLCVAEQSSYIAEDIIRVHNQNYLVMPYSVVTRLEKAILPIVY